ncbi:alpha/beta hydrolase [Virgibacillus halophilus]|uniref:alpha/beta hydrolase n=1 Tax=Tigheibacillus halophilus TaxID=361280 RepID=UPI0036288E47
MSTTFVYKQTDDCQMKGELYPASNENAPLLVYIHGGGLIWGTREDMKKEQIRMYNAAGFHVFSIEYRLAPESKLPSIIADIADVLKWLHSDKSNEIGHNRDKIAVMGSSAGGYLALMAGTFTVKPAAIISFYGYGDITGEWYKKPSSYFNQMTQVPKMLADQLIQPYTIASSPIEKRYAIYLYCRQQGKWLDYVVGNSTGDGLLDEYCPITKVTSAYPPTLLLHGDRDEDVPYEESVRMHKKLDAHGVKTKLISFQNAPHSFDNNMQEQDAVNAHEQVISCLSQWLQIPIEKK